MITWPDLEAALQGRAGWRRVGREYHGPCPVTGSGRDCCWIGAGATADVRVGCRACGVPLDGDAVRAHLDALCGAETHVTPVPATRPSPRRRVPHPAAVELAGALWRACGAVTGTPGAAYLESRGLSAPWPAAVRWLHADAAARIGLPLRAGAAGCLCYLFAGPGDADADAAALQCEAVTAGGAARAFWPGGPKRRTVGGDGCLDGGRRVFVARAGAPGVALCESVLDALAVARAPWGAPSGEAVIAAAGTSGLHAAAVASWPGPVTIWTHGDGPGVRAALRLRLALEATGRAVQTPTPPQGLDWADVAQQDQDERAAIQAQDGVTQED